MELLFKQRTGDSKNTEKTIIAYFNGKNKPQISTKIKVKPSNFLNQKVVKIYDKHRINALLDRMRLLFKEEQLEYKRKGLPLDKAVLTRVVNEALGITEVKEGEIKLYTEYVPLYMKRLDKMKNNSGEIGLTKQTQKTYKSNINCYNRYEKWRVENGYSPMSLQYGTIEDMEAYQDYLEDEMEYSADTINKRIGMVVAVSRHAKKRKHKVSEDITEYDVPSKQPRKREDIVFLSNEEVELITTPIEDLPDYLLNTQRIVILQIATGQRISDTMNYTASTFTENEGEITGRIRQQKTNREISIPIVGERAVGIVKTGLFRAISHQKYNDYIKELGKRAGINTITKSKMVVDKRLKEVETEKYKLITSHTFRRTALSLCFLAGIPEYHILNISGHSRVNMLYRYLGRDEGGEQRTKELREMMLKAFE